MKKATDWTDEYTLLCEACGYVLAELPADGDCPECGRAIATSMPGARIGSPWQRRPGIAAWCATAWTALVHPRRLHQQLRIGSPADRSLLLTNFLVAGSVTAALPTYRLLAGSHPVVAWAPKAGVYAGEYRHVITALVATGTVGVVFIFLWLLTWIEASGVRFFGSRRGWRTTRLVARSVTSHASFGWVLAMVLFTLGWATIDLDLFLARRGQQPTLRSRYGDLLALAPVVGFFIGMLLFELRVFQGMRACRFANRPSRHARIDRE